MKTIEEMENMIPIIIRLLKHTGFLKKSICIDCVNKKEKFDYCKYNAKVTTNYYNGKKTQTWEMCSKRNENGNCPFFEEKL